MQRNALTRSPSRIEWKGRRKNMVRQDIDKLKFEWAIIKKKRTRLFFHRRYHYESILIEPHYSNVNQEGESYIIAKHVEGNIPEYFGTDDGFVIFFWDDIFAGMEILDDAFEKNDGFDEVKNRTNEEMQPFHYKYEVEINTTAEMIRRHYR